MAVHGDARLVDVRHVLLDLADEVAELLRDRVADGVGDVDGRRPGVDAFGEHAVDVRGLRARRVHRRELHVVAVLLRPSHHRPRHLQHALLVALELVHDVDVRAREEDVDARVLRVLHCFPAGVHVARHRPGQPRDRGASNLLRDLGDGIEISWR